MLSHNDTYSGEEVFSAYGEMCMQPPFIHVTQEVKPMRYQNKRVLTSGTKKGGRHLTIKKATLPAVEALLYKASTNKIGAENGIRTRDPRLGKPMLYH
jgi:hypothetical protein